jgi:hypothetical protein
MVRIYLEVTMVDLLRKVVTYFWIAVVVLEEIILIEDLVYHEWNRCFLEDLTENEYVKLNIIEII